MAQAVANKHFGRDLQRRLQKSSKYSKIVGKFNIQKIFLGHLCFHKCSKCKTNDINSKFYTG